MSINVSDHQGIETYWAHTRDPIASTSLHGALFVGVGHMDEPQHLAGITHLLEHLVFRRLALPFTTSDGVTYSRHLEFSVDGEPSAVAEFLNSVAMTLRHVEFSDDELRREMRILRAEQPSALNGNPGLLTTRYGAAGAGRPHAGTPGLAAITVDEVNNWARDWCTAPNSRMVFDGPVPDGLDVCLPSGGPIERSPVAPLVEDRRVVLSAKSGVALTLRVPAVRAELLATAVVEEILDDLRTRRALIYNADPEFTRVDREWSELSVVLDPVEEDTHATLVAVLALLDRLSIGGLAPTAGATARGQALLNLGQPFSPLWLMYSAAAAGLCGWPTETTAECARVRIQSSTDELLSGDLCAALASVVVMVDECAEGDIDAVVASFGWFLDEGEIWATTDVRPRRKAHRRRGSRRTWVTVESGYLYTGGPFATERIELADVSLVLRDSQGDLRLIDHRGRGIDVWAAGWTRGASYVAEVLAALPPGVVRDLPSWPEPPGENDARRG